MNLPGHDYRWLALRAIWRDATIRRLGRVIVARSIARRDRFPSLETTHVIAAIRTERNGDRSLIIYPTSDIGAVIAGRVSPLMTIQTQGVRLEVLDSFFVWPQAEAIWKEFHNAEIEQLLPPESMTRLVDSWTEFKAQFRSAQTWELYNTTNSEVLSIILRTEATTGDMAIIEVVPQEITVYLGDLFFDPVPNRGFQAVSVPAENPDVDVLREYVTKREAHDARVVMRWYRRAIYDILLSEFAAGKI